MHSTPAEPNPVEINPVEINPSSLVCQRWVDGRHTWKRRRDGGFNATSYTVEPISDKDAKQFTLTHHYSRTYPAAARRYGLYQHSLLVGAAVFSIPAQARVLTNVFPELTPYKESLELGRFVLLGEKDDRPGAEGGHSPPSNAESWFLARCHEYLHQDGVRGVVSFADPVPRRVDGEVLFPGHVGIIYQASNAAYTGRGTRRTITMLPDGTTISERALQKVRGQESGHEYVERRLVCAGARVRKDREDPTQWLSTALAQVNASKLTHRGNLRYAMATSRADRKHLQVFHHRKPYPKRPDAA